MSSFSTVNDLRRQWVSTPYSQYGLSGSILTAGLMNSGRRGLPSPLLSAGYAFAFGYSGFLIQQGNVKDGALASTAWSLAYSASYTFKALTSFRPIPVILAGASLANLAFHGSALVI